MILAELDYRIFGWINFWPKWPHFSVLFNEYSAKSRDLMMVLTWFDGIFVKNPCNDGEGAVSQNSEGSGYHNPVVVSLSFTHHLQVLYLFNKRRLFLTS